jgi:hypothetical protein
MKKKLMISLIILFILAMILGITFILFLYERDKNITLIDDDIVIEYGNIYNPSIEELIDLSKYDFINLDKLRIENNIENELEKNYPAVGEYEISVNYKNIVLKQKVEVIDTIAPELNIQESIELDNGVDLSTIDFNQYITRTDLSEMKDYNIDLGAVDTNKAGEYRAKVSIEDIYGNSSEKEFTIIIKEKVQQEEETITENENKSNTSISSSNKTTSSNNTNNSSSKTNSNTKETTSTNQSSTSKTQSSNSNVSTNNQNNNSGSTTATEEKYWCVDGGTHHVAGDGANEHGYYKTWDEAYNAFLNYTANWSSSQYKVSCCACGLYYFWAIQ